MRDISPLKDQISALYEKYKDDDEGDIATYIPELGKANPADFGISLATVSGEVFSVGNCQQEFTIQSICKPMAFLMALERHGREKTLQHVGIEPSGDPFNSIELDPKHGRPRPFNPMVNAGAISVASLIKGPGGTGVAEYVQRLGLAAGRTLRIDEAVRDSESATGHRNRAIAWLMRNFDIIDEEVDQTLDQYFSQCSVLVNCADLALIGATLANTGENPVTQKDVFNVQYVKDALAVMFTCGMYDYAGEWAYRVGVPAKSGVSGGIMAVVNRQLSIAVYSPRLDTRGNSVRGIKVCTELSNEFGLHAFDFMNVGSNFIGAM
ncbi:MAG: glutaminase A [Verrucomicrobiales bacterium]|nr:glutaminase A [Verrucomicrobiales bacterium]